VANDIIRKLESLVPELTEALGQASSLEELEELRVRFLGRKGRLADLMSGLTSLTAEERPAAGKAANQVKGAMTSLWEERVSALKVEQQQKALDAFDCSVPSWQPDLGSLLGFHEPWVRSGLRSGS
jgi:phenylalanyl-tRNA synthetase alpha chain